MFPNFERLTDWRELIRGGLVPQAGQSGVSPWSDLPLSGRTEVTPWSDLPLNRILYIPFSIFAYSSNIFITSFGGNLEIS